MYETTWEVRFDGGRHEHVTAESWEIFPNGDLVFGRYADSTQQGMRVTRFTPQRAFAAGTWKEVRAYA